MAERHLVLLLWSSLRWICGFYRWDGAGRWRWPGEGFAPAPGALRVAAPDEEGALCPLSVTHPCPENAFLAFINQEMPTHREGGKFLKRICVLDSHLSILSCTQALRLLNTSWRRSQTPGPGLWNQSWGGKCSGGSQDCLQQGRNLLTVPLYLQEKLFWKFLALTLCFYPSQDKKVPKQLFLHHCWNIRALSLQNSWVWAWNKCFHNSVLKHERKEQPLSCTPVGEIKTWSKDVFNL